MKHADIGRRGDEGRSVTKRKGQRVDAVHRMHQLLYDMQAPDHGQQQAGKLVSL